MENKVREKRLEKGMSQQCLAVTSKVSRVTISKIENGHLKQIKSKTMFKIANALDEDIGNIFFDEIVVFKQQKR